MSVIGVIEWSLRKKNQLPETFKFCSWACMPKESRETIYYEIKGGTPHTIKSGKNKGRDSWKGCQDITTFFVPVHEAKEMAVEYEVETGNCYVCQGEGKTVSGMNFVSGEVRYRECSECGGTCKPKELFQGATQ